MSAITTTIVRVAAPNPFLDGRCEPDTYAHRTRRGLCRVRWWITAGKNGRVLAGGRAWTRGAALEAAVEAARQPPNIPKPRRFSFSDGAR